KMGLLATKMYDRPVIDSFLSGAFCACALVLAPMTVAHGGPVDEIIERQTASRNAYAEIARQMSLSEERLAAISAEVGSLKKDERTLTAALIQAAKTERKLGEEAREIGERIAV